jgi:2-polyprenyl-3-methyl-5-hydroxy-6-metoxy-1,4-benzoquinol methylase
VIEKVTDCSICGSSDLSELDAVIALCQCQKCGLVFRNPRPTQRAIAQYYSKHGQYDDWLAHEHGRYTLWQRRLQIMGRYGRRGRLLDVGSGIGQFLSVARDHYEVEGTEISRRAVEIANDKYGLRLHRGALEDIDFHERRFEVITLFHVLEHVCDPRALLSRCRELLSSDGIIVMAIPNEIHGWKRVIKGLLAVAGSGGAETSKWYGLKKLQLETPGEELHLSHFTIHTIRRLVNSCRLRVVDEDLDPCHASTGAKQLVLEVAFHVCKLAHNLAGVQCGEAIWIAAARSEAPT